jgi:hypothetical protein
MPLVGSGRYSRSLVRGGDKRPIDVRAKRPVSRTACHFDQRRTAPIDRVFERIGGCREAEKRDDGWATQTETALRTSFDAEGSLPRGALKSVECRSSKCRLELYLSAESSPRAVVEQQAAITHWIAVNQPCAYTMTNPAAASQPMLIFLDCKR